MSRAFAALVLIVALAGCSRPDPTDTTPVEVPAGAPAPPESAVPFGAAVAAEPAQQDADYVRAFAGGFDTLALENSTHWGVIHPYEGEYRFGQTDVLVDLAEATGKRVRGQLVWDQVLPAWVAQEEHTRAELRSILVDHVRTIVSRYRGRIDEWVVVNEPLTDEGPDLERSVWLRTIGPSYVRDAFEAARAADPDATLILNEIAAERGAKFDALLRLARRLKDHGVPFDAVGLQNHTTADDFPTRAELASDMRRIARAGLDAQITEMDVVVEPEAGLRRQTAAFRAAARACAQAERCTGFTVWGVTDTHSWKGAEARALLFDGAGRAKPGYDAVVDELRRRGGP